MREVGQPDQALQSSTDHPKCIDISHWQDFPDFEAVRAAGVIAMIHKATEGTGYTDPNRAKNCSAAVAAGIKVCTYHWLKPGNAADQMAYYLRVVDPVYGERVVIDYEEDGCTLDDLHAAVDALLNDPRDLQITVYSGHLLKEQLGSKHDSYLADNTDLWLAQYTTGTPSWPSNTYPQWALWQYSESGSVDGIDGSAVDLNRFNGSDAELLRWISPAADPVPVPDRSEVLIEVTAPPNVKVTVRVNEEE
jgi:lysozyme